MIFLDESGKRWRRIKTGTGLLGSGVIIPVVILLGATLLYLPGWGSLSLPKTIKTALQGNPKVSSGSQVLAAQSTNKDSNPNISKNPSVSTDSSVPNTTISAAPQPAAATTQTPAAQVVNTTQPTPAPTTSNTAPGLANQPDQTGNSDYGHSHQPTRF